MTNKIHQLDFELVGNEIELYERYGKLAIKYSDEGNHKKAVELFDKILEEEPTAEFALVLKAKNIFNAATKEIITWDSKFFEENNFVDAFNGIKIKFAEVIELLNKVLAANPDNFTTVIIKHEVLSDFLDLESGFQTAYLNNTYIPDNKNPMPKPNDFYYYIKKNGYDNIASLKKDEFRIKKKEIEILEPLFNENIEKSREKLLKYIQQIIDATVKTREDHSTLKHLDLLRTLHKYLSEDELNLTTANIIIRQNIVMLRSHLLAPYFEDRMELAEATKSEVERIGKRRFNLTVL